MSAPSLDTSAITTIPLEEVYSTGAPSSGAAWGFGRVVSVAVDSGGAAYVADGQARQIVLVDTTGSVSDVLGRAGDGPGEFSMISWVDVSPSGDIWVKDPLAKRLTIFAARTREPRTVRYPAIGRDTSIPWLASFVRDSVLSVVEHRLEARWSRAAVVSYRLRDEVLLEESRQVLPVFERPAWVQSTVGRVRTSSAPPFSPVVAVAPARAGAWRAYTSDFRLELLDDSARVVQTVVYPLRGQSVPKRTRDSIAAALSIEEARVPAEVPPILTLQVDEADRVWVGVTEDGVTLTLWHVFDATGRHVARFLPPRELRFRPHQVAIRGRMIAGVVENALEVQDIVVLRVPDRFPW